MTLEGYERALARLATDAALRERFAVDPSSIGAEPGLDAADVERLAALDRDRLELFAEQLVAKRYGEVRSQLARAATALGEDELRRRFEAFARDFLPEGVHKHRADALAFAATLGEAGRFDGAALGLFHRLDGRAARARRGPALALTQLDGRRLLLVRPRGAARYRVVRLW